MMLESRHVSALVDRPVEEVYAYVSDPTNLPAWAPGLCTSLEQVEGQWIAESGMGRITLEFVPRNEFGVLDHTVTLASGERFHNPMRVMANGSGSEVVFTVRRQVTGSGEDFERDITAVSADLTTLKRLLEAD
jgi:hypothetical protein